MTKLDSSGNILWTRMPGSTLGYYGRALALDTAGRVWIGGDSGATNSRAFVAEYDSAGTLLGTMLWGGSITGLAAAPDGSVSVSGYTTGALGAANLGSYDIWAASLANVPEPSSGLLLAAGAGLLLRRRCR